MRIEDERTLAGLVIALGVVVALIAPDLSHLFAPYLHQSLFFVVLFSLLPFARQNMSEITHFHPAVASLIVWQQFILPFAGLVIGRAVGMDNQTLFLVVVVLTSGCLFASPTLVQIMGLDQKMAMQSVVLSTLAAPVSIFISIIFIFEDSSAINMGEFGNRIALYLVAPIILLSLVRMATKNLNRKQSITLERVGRWGSVLALLVFCFALEEQIALVLADDPTRVLGFIAIAVAISVVSALLTRVVMARFGSHAATTASVLASFRNVGLTYGLVESIGNNDLLVFVGACQIPMFFTPLLFDLFFGNARFRKSSSSDSDSAAKPSADAGIAGAGGHGSSSRSSHVFDAGADSVLLNQKTDYFQQFEVNASAINSNISGYEVQMNSNKHNKSNTGMLNTSVALAIEPEEFEQVEVVDEKQQLQKLVERLRGQRDEAQSQIEKIGVEQSDRSAQRYLAVLFIMLLVGIAGIWQANKYFSPMLFNQDLLEQVATAHTSGRNFATYDLNINIRDLREATIARMTEAPEAVVLGASHWQEANVELVTGKKFYNSHVHRDYYEDMLAVTEMYVRHNKLPSEMIIAIRDNLFTPVDKRTDFLWLPGIKYYRAMADRLGIDAHGWWETLPVNTWRELISLPLLWSQASRDLMAGDKPHVTEQRQHDTLDILLPGGSITWSGEHKRLFTAERARSEALSFAEARRNDPPVIDPKGVEHMQALLEFLMANNVKVTLAHPQFNPLFWEAVQGSPYMDGLKQVEDLTQSWARQFNLPVIGGFSPESVGCTADMYIDAEHGNSACLGKLLQQYNLLNVQPGLRGTLTW